MFRRILNAGAKKAVRGTLTFFLRDFFENVTSENFEDLRIGTSIHVVLRNLAIKQHIGAQILKQTPLKLLHCGIERLQAELTLNTKQARKLLLREVNIVLEYNPEWAPPPPPTSDAPPPPIPSGISGAAAIVYSTNNTGEVLEDSFLRDDMKELLSRRDLGEEEAFKVPEDEVDQSASAIAALLKELVHHSEVAIDRLTVRIRFPPSSSSNSSTTNEMLIRFPSIFIRDKTAFDGRPSDQFAKFISIAPPIIQVYPLQNENTSTSATAAAENNNNNNNDNASPVTMTSTSNDAASLLAQEAELDYENTLLMGYGFLNASDKMARVRQQEAEQQARLLRKNASSRSLSSSGDDDENGQNNNNNNNNDNSTTDDEGEVVEPLDFSTVMESERCITIEIVRQMLQPRVPTWDVKISTTPFLMCARPYQIGLLLDIGYRIQNQSKHQEQVLRERQQEAEKQARALMEEKARKEAQLYPRNFYNNNTLHVDQNNSNNTNSSAAAGATTTTAGNASSCSSRPVAPTTFHIAIKCQHGVVALFSTDALEPVQDCWESIEDYDSFITTFEGQSKDSETSHLPLCLAQQTGYFALSLGSGKIVIEKNNSKNSVMVSSSKTSSAKGSRRTISDKHENDDNDSSSSSATSRSESESDADETTSSTSDSTGSNEVEEQGNDDNNFMGDTEEERFLDRYTETTLTASLGSLVFVERASSDPFVRAVKVLELDNRNNNNNNNNTTAASSTSTTTKDMIAGEIIIRITEQIPFHDVLRHKCINLSGVRYRHPTSSEGYSQALLKSTVTVKDVALNAKGTVIVRLEPTVLGRVVDLMNFINNETIKKAMARNDIPLPTMKDLRDFEEDRKNKMMAMMMMKDKEEKQKHEDSTKKKNKKSSSSKHQHHRQDDNNNENSEENQKQQQQFQPFHDDAMTVSLNFHEIDLQCLLLKSRKPAPDIWGPLTVRMFEHLGKDGKEKDDEIDGGGAATNGEEQHQSSEESDQQQNSDDEDDNNDFLLNQHKTHLLPRSFIIRGKDMKFKIRPGTEPTQAELIITSAEAGIKLENGEIRTLLKISPSEKIPRFSLQAAVKTDAFGVPRDAKTNESPLDPLVQEIARRPTDSRYGVQKKLKDDFSSIAVDIKIPRVHGVNDILMDDMIFMLFAVTELSEISLPLSRYIPLDETAAYVAAKSFIPNNVVSVCLELQEISLFIGAPRLDKNGECLGEPLSSLLPPGDAPTNLALALHRYEIRAAQLTMTMGIVAEALTTQHWALELGLGGFSLREHLIEYDGRAGPVQILLDSFAEAHRRSIETTTTTSTSTSANNHQQQRSGRVFNLTLLRDTCFQRRTDTMDIGVVVDCISLVHQASHEGDSWPSVLAHWAADSPVPVKAGERIHARGRVQRRDVVPLASCISVNVKARDLLLDWKAEMRKERLAVLISELGVEIPQLVAGDPKMTVTIRVPQPVALLLHNDFPTPIIEYDRAKFIERMPVFGSSRKNALEDLQAIGFAPLCKFGPRPASSSSSSASSSKKTTTTTQQDLNNNSPTIIVRKAHPGTNKKLQVEIHHFFTEFSFAPDSCALFIAFIEHIQDPKYVTQCVLSPLRLTRCAGGNHYSVVYPSEKEGPPPAAARAFDQDFDALDDEWRVLSMMKEQRERRSNAGTVSNVSRSSTRATESTHSTTSGSTTQQQQRHQQPPEVHINEDEWDVPNVDDKGREKLNAFTLRQNVLPSIVDELTRMTDNNNNVHQNQQQQQQQQSETSTASALSRPTLGSLMSNLSYFKLPSHQESTVAEPLFNVPSVVEFELLLHSCDFKLNFFSGSDFEIVADHHRGDDANDATSSSSSSAKRHRDPNNTSTTDTAEQFTFDEEELSRHSMKMNSNTNSFTTADDFTAAPTVPVFDVNQRRHRRRKARNTSESVALWLTHCFTQVDIFPSLDADDDGSDVDCSDVASIAPSSSNGNINATTTTTSPPSSAPPPRRKPKKTLNFVPVRQIIFRAGEVELEDLVHQSPVRKMLYCALPKSQRDAPVLTLRVRTLQKDPVPDDVVAPAPPPNVASSSSSSSFSPSSAPTAAEEHDDVYADLPPSASAVPSHSNLSAAAATTTTTSNVGTSALGAAIQRQQQLEQAVEQQQQAQTRPTFESMMQKKVYQKLEAHQVSVRVLPLGINVAARTVLKVFSAFVNMDKTKVAVSNKRTLPSVASAATSLASLAQSQNSGITGMRPLNSNARLEDDNDNDNNNTNNNRSNDDEVTEVESPPVFFDKLIIHPIDVRVSWFPDESLSNNKKVANMLGNALFIVRNLAIDGARLSLSRLSLSSVKADGVAQMLFQQAWPQLKTSKLLLLLAGLQPVRPAAEVAGALSDLVLTPLEYWQHQRSIFVGIARGIQTCTSRLVAESLTLSATGTRLGQHAALVLTKGVQQNPTPMLWGNQPKTAGEGAVRALQSVGKGVLNFGAGVRFCVTEMNESSVAGGLLRMPLAALIPVEGVLRGMTEAILGVRNTIRPEERMRDTQEYKSTVFSHKRGDSDEEKDN